MKLKQLITATALSFSIAGGFAINHWYQNTSYLEPIKTEITMPTGNFNYAKAWEEVTKFDEDQLPKSALEKVREIQKNAESDKNYQQLIKSYIFSIDYVKEVEEDNENQVKSYTKELMKFREVAGSLPTEFKAISYNIIAKFYEEYYNMQRWSIQQRTKLENDTDPDMNTWCIERFEKEVRAVYELSLAELETLKNFSIKDFDILIETDNRNIDTRLRPTLLDYLACDYLNMNSKFGVASDFTYQDIELVSENGKFLNFSPKNKETESMDNRRLEIYKMLAKAHEGDEDPTAYVNATLERLKYYKQRSTNELSGQEYQKTLELMRKNYDKPEIAAWLTYEIADHQYQEEKYQESHKTAEFCLDPKYKSTEYGKSCERLIHNIELAELSLTADEMVSPKSKFPIKAQYRNISKLYIKVLKLTDKEKYEKLWRNEERLKFLKDNCEKVRSYEFITINTGDYQKKNSEVIIDALPVGNYVILGGDNEDVLDIKKNRIQSICQIQSTNISIMKSQEMEDNCVFYVLDRKSGEGIANADIKLADRYRKINEKYKSDKYGAVVIPAQNNSYNAEYTISVGDDKVFLYGSIPAANKADNTESSHTQIFTDRAIYRPGQTIYWKVIAYQGSNKESKVSANKSLRLAINDVNRKCIHDITIKTNEYGSASGEFQIPTGLANGEFTIICEGCNHRVSVEEYKRPKFEVSFGNVDGEVRIGGKVGIDGQASTYSGENVADAKVKYTVIRNSQWRGWWYWEFNAKSKVIDFGETVTDKDGKFKVEFTAVPDPQQAESEHLQYNYTIKASVTDANGETRDANTTVSAGYRSLFLGISAPSEFNIMDRTNLSELRVSSTNINGQNLPAEVTVKVSRLLTPNKIYIPKRWESCDNPIVSREDWERELPYTEYAKEDQGLTLLKPEKLLKTITVNTAENSIIDLSFIKKEGSGSYLIELSATDKEGRPVKYEQRFTIYNTADKISSVNKTMLISSDKSEYKPGDVAHITIGTALPDVEMHYIISNGYQHLESNMVRLNANTTVIDLPIKEEFLGGVKVSAFFIKENSVFTEEINLSVPSRHKELKIEFETFRDRLYPGEGEKWKLRISDHKNNPAMAEMLATLYDESLDALRENSWSLWPYHRTYIANPYSAELFNHLTSQNLHNDDNTYHNPVYGYKISPQLNWYGHEPSMWRRFCDEVVVCGYGRSKRGLARGVKYTAQAYTMANDDMEVAEMEVEEEMVSMDAGEASDNSADNQDFSNANIRTNFSETAFFQPHIATDANGELYVEFTVPESITRWKMLGIAHTKDMCLGTTENHLVTKKDFSVEPNLPRFLRCGDKISIPAKISNLLTDAQISGKVKIEILDPDTEKPVSEITIKNQIQDFAADANSSTVRHFDIEVGQYVKPVIIKIVAISGDKSDGEQHILPILTDKKLVTESMTLSVRGGQTKQFEFKEWKQNTSTSAVNHSFTLEYTSNPAWYAVTSLPWLTEDKCNCYDYKYSRLFANSISALIIANNPNIDKMLTQWKKDNTEALISPLEKNQELKSLILDATPWALDARNENEQMSKLSELLDKNRVSAENEKILSQLEKGQLYNGAWPWFDGMRESAGITQYIVTGFGRMRQMGVNLDNRTINMINKAIGFLDKEAVEYHKKCLKWETDPGFYGIQFMYMRTFFSENKMDKKTKEAYEFFYNFTKKNWTKFSLHNQALLLITFNRAGDKELAQKIMKSFNERAIHSEEFGMYFKENVNGIYWHEQNIATQAIVIEAYQEMKKAEEIEELKIWLIKNRQANHWNTANATTEAVYAMFICGNKIQSDEPLCTITLGNQPISNDGAEAGTGYIKHQWDGKEMDIRMADIKVMNPNNHISYGAVYRQYFEKLDNIKSADNKLKIEKQIFLITKDAHGNDQLTEIKDKTKVHPGNKVKVRFIIKTDRDLEYVHLMDMRPAGMEPLNVLSQTKYQDGMFYYESTKDASENFFIEHLNKGTYVFEYPLVAVHSGNFSAGIATIQCMYAPEFVAHSEGMRFSISE